LKTRIRTGASIHVLTDTLRSVFVSFEQREQYCYDDEHMHFTHTISTNVEINRWNIQSRPKLYQHLID